MDISTLSQSLPKFGFCEDNSSKHWTWVFPAGGTFILALCLLSRWRSQRKEREEQVRIGAL